MPEHGAKSAGGKRLDGRFQISVFVQTREPLARLGVFPTRTNEADRDVVGCDEFVAQSGPNRTSAAAVGYRHRVVAVSPGGAGHGRAHANPVVDGSIERVAKIGCIGLACGDVDVTDTDFDDNRF